MRHDATQRAFWTVNRATPIAAMLVLLTVCLTAALGTCANSESLSNCLLARRAHHQKVAPSTPLGN